MKVPVSVAGVPDRNIGEKGASVSRLESLAARSFPPFVHLPAEEPLVEHGQKACRREEGDAAANREEEAVPSKPGRLAVGEVFSLRLVISKQWGCGVEEPSPRRALHAVVVPPHGVDRLVT